MLKLDFTEEIFVYLCRKVAEQNSNEFEVTNLELDNYLSRKCYGRKKNREKQISI